MNQMQDTAYNYNMVDIKQEVWLPEDLIPAANKEIKKLNYRVGKLGCRGITLEITDVYRDEAYDESSKEYRRSYLCILIGEAPKLNDWSLVAVIQHEQAGNIIRRLPPFNQGEDARIAPYLTGSQKCEHCGQTRLRKDTYLVAHPTEGLKEVGSSCLQEFTGYDKTDKVLSYLISLESFLEILEGDGMDDDEGIIASWLGGGIGTNRYINTLDYLIQVALVIRLYGWVSKAQTMEGNRATADIALDNLLGALKPKLVETDEDVELAMNALEWARQEIPNRPYNDYEHNLLVALASDNTNVRNTGIVASVINFYQRVLQKELERQQAALESEWVGEVNTRIVIHVKVTSCNVLGNYYGPTYCYHMVDEAGNRFTWFASNPDLEENGSPIWLLGTVKKHDSFNGVKQTVLTRCQELDPAQVIATMAKLQKLAARQPNK